MKISKAKFIGTLIFGFTCAIYSGVMSHSVLIGFVVYFVTVAGLWAVIFAMINASYKNGDD